QKADFDARQYWLLALLGTCFHSNEAPTHPTHQRGPRRDRRRAHPRGSRPIGRRGHRRGRPGPRRQPWAPGRRMERGRSACGRLRNGGSWGFPQTEPDYVGWYGCTKSQAVWGPRGKGIDMSRMTWTVITGGETGPLTTRAVVKAYFVATAP